MSERKLPSRRRLLQSGAAVAALAACPIRVSAAESSDVTARLARYMVSARDQELPPAVLLECKHRILDTFGAMVSGSRMTPGMMGLKYVRGLGGEQQASVIGSKFRTTAVNAALANAMCAHSDETDDFEPVTKAHPGSSVVPAALAMAEKEGRSGQDMIRAVALGYDLGCRLLMALGPDLVRGAPERGRNSFHVLLARRSGFAGAARRTGHAVRDLLFRPAGLRPVELGQGQGPCQRRRSTSPA